MTNSKKDEYYMNMALALAKRGEGNTSPNPMVGAVLVKNGKIIGRGYHKKTGLAHAEIEALEDTDGSAKGATLYVNLEPCDHFGRTPPCTERIIEKSIKRVVIGMKDPNPINNGRGITRLRQNGIVVRCGLLEEECKDLNRVFRTYITKKRPYITVKVAQSLDGKIATYTGDSRWITSESSRRYVHRLRSRVDAVLVGVNTVIKDDPVLNSRQGSPKRQPIRVVLDSRLKTPKDSRIIKDKSTRTILAVTELAPKKRVIEFQKTGVEIAILKEDKGMVDLRSLLRYLAADEVSHLLVEGGGTVIAGFLTHRLVDEMLVFISPKIIGGRDAVTSVEGDGVRRVAEAIRLEKIKVKRFGEDILIQGYVHRDN